MDFFKIIWNTLLRIRHAGYIISNTSEDYLEMLKENGDFQDDEEMKEFIDKYISELESAKIAIEKSIRSLRNLNY